MAAEARVGHIRVSDTASGNGVGHGRLGYRGVYGSVMCPWFVKREKIRTGLSDGKSSASGNAQQSMRFDTQKGGLVYQRAFGWHLVPETRT